LNEDLFCSWNKNKVNFLLIIIMEGLTKESVIELVNRVNEFLKKVNYDGELILSEEIMDMYENKDSALEETIKKLILLDGLIERQKY